MIRIGVIGDISSGKSFVAKQFGYPVFNADVEVAKLYKSNKKCYLKLNKLLPKYITSFPVKKKNLLEAIMENKKNLNKIIKVVHPVIRFKMNNFIKKNKSKKIVILDIPLLLENKINKKNDILIFVDTKKKEINKRFKKKHKTNIKIMRRLRKLQLPVEHKKKKSNFIIKNNFSKNFTKKSVKKILKEILKNA